MIYKNNINNINNKQILEYNNLLDNKMKQKINIKNKYNN